MRRDMSKIRVPVPYVLGMIRAKQARAPGAKIPCHCDCCAFPQIPPPTGKATLGGNLFFEDSGVAFLLGSGFWTATELAVFFASQPIIKNYPSRFKGNPVHGQPGTV